jgi:hypothetical protein
MMHAIDGTLSRRTSCRVLSFRGTDVSGDELHGAVETTGIGASEISS